MSVFNYNAGACFVHLLLANIKPSIQQTDIFWERFPREQSYSHEQRSGINGNGHTLKTFEAGPGRHFPGTRIIQHKDEKMQLSPGKTQLSDPKMQLSLVANGANCLNLIGNLPATCQ